ncbi:aconitate hydratase 2 [Syntrophotalea carbinolica DSM 2380]|uniref:Aconitate hydratase B n=1 Tax=Syntrophotalea carbinolica (strain DSM 2380 / NBRC 103641 / GraBd1) TaxID=338963 RepID=Q3A2K3_SYNC1|nr:bifunctional aconitate hydratase 2/2-methylisocitrate dehydratase [Syntrophotalea carbinolica]ABA89404.1 aconitate hydratase 2 [Syntrophotalea carbinolica DSM 2380]
MLNEYLQHVDDRAAMGIPPLPLSAEQTEALCRLLTAPPSGRETLLADLLKNRVSPGVDPAAQVKADFLGRILRGGVVSPLVDKTTAVELLGAMLGGYNIAPLLGALRDAELAPLAVEALSGMTLVYDAFDDIVALAENNDYARQVLENWAAASWFTSRPKVPESIRVKVFKVEGEINTDDFSPAGDAWSRPDIPLHALSMGGSRFAGGIETIAAWRKAGHQVAFVGDVVGTGSSRKSACNSLLWHIGEDIPGVPNKRRGGVIIGGAIAPIFFNTAQDSGALPIHAEVDKLEHGAEVTIEPLSGRILDSAGKLLTSFELAPNTLPDEYQAGGRIPLIIGRSLTERARKVLKVEPADFFTLPDNPVPQPDQGYTLAQKLVGKACGLPGVLPGTACEPRMTTVGSQDTTGPMTADELKELACLKFQTPLFMQSFCHTAAYPKPADVKMHHSLPEFMAERGGVALHPGDGVIHSWLNRLLLPDTVGTGGDSHTRFPMGISFPAGSGLVAFAGALGFMPLDMPESVLVRFKGSLKPGITLRDVVNAIPYTAINQGLLTVPKKNKKNIFNGRILEMEGLEDLTVEQAFELTCAAAERSAAAGCIQLNEEQVATFLRSNLALMKSLIEDGYEASETLQNRIDAVEEWLKNPTLLRADAHARYAAVIEVDLDELNEPLICCPNDPDDVHPLSEIAGEAIDDVFIGSCMSNIGHFRAAAAIWEGRHFNDRVRTWVCPPTRMDHQQLKDEALFATFSAIGARIELPGCSLCMGNQARVPARARVFSTSTRNFDNRLGDDAQVYLGSAELAAIIGWLGRIPTVERYFAIYEERISSRTEDIYRYLQLDEKEALR